MGRLRKLELLFLMLAAGLVGELAASVNQRPWFLPLMSAVLALIGVVGMVAGVLHLTRPAEMIRFYKWWNERHTHPLTRFYWIPVDRSSARSMGVGYLLVGVGAVVQVLLVTK